MAIKLPDGRMMDDFGQIYNASDEFEIDVIGDAGSGTGNTGSATGPVNQGNGRGGSGQMSDLFVNIGIGLLGIIIIVLAFYFGFNS